MRQGPIAQFKNKVSETMAAAESGEEIVGIRYCRDSVKLVPVEEDRMARQRVAVNAAYALGQRIKARNGPTTAAEIREWIDEGRP